MVARVGCVNNTPSRQEPILSRVPGTHALDQPFRRAGRDGEREGWGRHPSPQPKFDDSFAFRELRAKP